MCRVLPEHSLRILDDGIRIWSSPQCVCFFVSGCPAVPGVRMMMMNHTRVFGSSHSDRGGEIGAVFRCPMHSLARRRSGPGGLVHAVRMGLVAVHIGVDEFELCAFRY